MDRFSITKRSAGSEDLPCTFWFPKGALTGCILMGHGLGADREHMTNQVAVDALLPHGLAVLAMDAPQHGERQTRPYTPHARVEAWQAYWRDEGHNKLHTEWMALADYAAERLEVPLGYWGQSLATHYGVPFLAKDHRIKAGVLGLHGEGPVLAHYAPQISQPVCFIEQRKTSCILGNRPKNCSATLAPRSRCSTATRAIIRRFQRELCRRLLGFLPSKYQPVDGWGTMHIGIASACKGGRHGRLPGSCEKFLAKPRKQDP